MMESDETEQFAERLIEALIDRGHHAPRQARSGVDVRILMKLTGKSRQAVSKWVNGESIPKPDVINDICKGLNLSYFWLRYRRGTMAPGVLDELFVELGPTIDSLELPSEKEELKRAVVEYAGFIRDQIRKKPKLKPNN